MAAPKKKGGTKRPAPAGLPALAEELVAQPREKANNLPRLLAALKPGCTEVRWARRGSSSRGCRLPPPLPLACSSTADYSVAHPLSVCRLAGHAGAAPPTHLLH